MGIMGDINQIGIITPDIERSIEEFKKIGLTEWSEVFVNTPDKFEDMVAYGRPCEYSSKCASNFDLNIEIELIEPLDDKSDYAAFLKRNGGQAGIHHLRVDFDDMADVNATGKELLLSGVAAGSGMAYEYYDFKDELGLVLEYFPVDR
ncbi:MAG: VOC family protein [Eggerthellaceae bacterium]|nr:VOC family protein [Eggerthellaceae bacterium]